MFNTLYAKGSYLEDMNERASSEIKAAEKECSPFLIECSEVNGWWGIWLKVNDERLLVNPYDLTSTIYKDDRYYLFDTPKDEVGLAKYDGSFYIDVRMENHVFEWRMGHTALPDTGRRFYTYEEYISKINKAIIELRDLWKDGKQIAYTKFDVELDAVEMCLKQINAKHTLPSNCRLMAKDVYEDEFVFNPLGDECFEKYRIGMSNRTYDTFLTHWDSDFEHIRHQLESLAFEGKTTIKLPFDTSYTILKLSNTSVLDKTENIGEGVSFKYKDFMVVEIEPNGFVHQPILKGYCDVEKTARTFYEGLLRLALLHPMNYDCNDHDTPSRMVAYNKFKSPIFESYLRKEATNDNEYAIRQVHVKHIIRIEPDYNAIMFDEQETVICLGDFYDKDGKPIEMLEFEKWASEINPIVVASETSEPYKKDWEDYHRRGIELAKQLREKLSTDFDLWYAAPFEDKSGTIPKPMLII